MTDADAIKRVHAELTAEWGRIDVLFYNSGIWLRTYVEDFDSDNAARVVDVNLIGMMRAAGTVLPEMVARRNGDIVGMASLAGYRGYPRSAGYSSSKAGAIAFLQSIRMELQRYGVGVTTINPGFVKTPLTGHNSLMPFVMKRRGRCSRDYSRPAAWRHRDSLSQANVLAAEADNRPAAAGLRGSGAPFHAPSTTARYTWPLSKPCQSRINEA